MPVQNELKPTTSTMNNFTRLWLQCQYSFFSNFYSPLECLKVMFSLMSVDLFRGRFQCDHCSSLQTCSLWVHFYPLPLPPHPHQRRQPQPLPTCGTLLDLFKLVNFVTPPDLLKLIHYVAHTYMSLSGQLTSTIDILVSDGHHTNYFPLKICFWRTLILNSERWRTEVTPRCPLALVFLLT